MPPRKFERNRNLSEEVIYSVIRNSNRYLIKNRTGGTLSAEPNNLWNSTSFKHSGLARLKTVGLQPVQAGKPKGVILSLKRQQEVNKPRKSQVRIKLTKHFRATARAIKHTLHGRVNKYRPDLVKPALVRLTKIHQSLKPRKDIVKKTRRERRKERKLKQKS